MQRKFLAILSIVFMLMIGCGTSETSMQNDVNNQQQVDSQMQTSNQTQVDSQEQTSSQSQTDYQQTQTNTSTTAIQEDPYVYMVKKGHPYSYPDITYEQAFESFFGSPSWKYFVGTKEGPDDNGDGSPDYTENNIDIVEFTGSCTYQDVPVTALIQFTINKAENSFLATYLSFNDVPQTTVMCGALIDKAFSEYQSQHGNSTQTSATTSQDSILQPKPESADIKTPGTGKSDYAALKLIMEYYEQQLMIPNYVILQTQLLASDEYGRYIYHFIIDIDQYVGQDMDDTHAYVCILKADEYSFTYKYYEDSVRVTFESSEQSTLVQELKQINGFGQPFGSENNTTNSSSINSNGTTNSSQGNEYILPNSATVLLTENDLAYLSAQQLTYARNEIYARHGYVFESQELNNYFSGKSWYVVNPSYDGTLTDIERQNANFIKEYQEYNGLTYKTQ